MAARSACVRQLFEIFNVQKRIISQSYQPSYNACLSFNCLRSQLRYSSHGLAAAATSDNQPKEKSKKAKPIWYYNNKGLRQRKIDQLMRKAKELQESGQTENPSNDVYHMRNLMLILKKVEFTEKEMNKLFVGKPRVFSISKKQLYNDVMDLQDSGYPVEVVKKMIMKTPGFLLDGGNERSSIPKRLSQLKSLNITPKLTAEKCVYLVQKCPYLLKVKDISVLQNKLALLKRLGLNDQLIYELVMKNPNVLTMDEKAISDKVKYVTKVLGARIANFVKFPRTFSSSLQRIKERHQYLMNEGFMEKDSRTSERKLRAIVLTTDNDFIYRVTNTRMKDYREFQKQYREEQMNKQLDGHMMERLDLAKRVKEFGLTQDEQERTDERSSVDEGNNNDEDIDDIDFDDDDGDELSTPNESKMHVIDAFSHIRRRRQKTMSDEEWYNTPFPEIDHDNNNVFGDVRDLGEKKRAPPKPRWLRRKNRK